ncbi:MAG: P27 family phage terminase small subunit [Burkholderiaceae bacterium]
MTRKAPASLSAEAKTLWRATLDEYSFDSAPDFQLLRQLCESVDGVRACQKAIKRDGMLVTGSTGQVRQHPLLAAEAEYRRAVLACVRALRLNSTPEF